MSGPLAMSIPFAKTFAKLLSVPRPQPVAYAGDDFRVAVHSSGRLPREVESDANRDLIELCASTGTYALIDFDAAGFVFAKAYYQKYASVGGLVPGEQFPITCKGWGVIDLGANPYTFGRTIAEQQESFAARPMPARIATPSELFAAVLVFQQLYGIDILPSSETGMSVRAADAMNDACHIAFSRSSYVGRPVLSACGGSRDARVGAIGVSMLSRP
ncbi:MAG TPA: hypothetical protein VFL98_00995 [Candidatus Paceibacterota bacterium]|nr:hypothetical protein [Candidatus Paceibacterota bacterium]